jgi:23S rRNA (uracil1939-C5)-methyltransferase
LSFHILQRDFWVSAASFFQVNAPQAQVMLQYLLDNLPLSARSTLMDVYCGVGLFSAFMAPLVKSCIAIESSPSACRDFAANLDEFDNVTLYEGLAEHILPALDSFPDLLVVDPPRSGLDGAALDAIVAMQPPILAYVSCDPATLARDAKRLMKGGYTLKSTQPFDMFPQTYHVETVNIFKI